jgi:hypothetical protein
MKKELSNAEIAESLKRSLAKMQVILKTMEFLEIPNNGNKVNLEDLYTIFTDEKKCQELITKLRNKAFW